MPPYRWLWRIAIPVVLRCIFTIGSITLPRPFSPATSAQSSARGSHTNTQGVRLRLRGDNSNAGRSQVYWTRLRGGVGMPSNGSSAAALADVSASSSTHDEEVVRRMQYMQQLRREIAACREVCMRRCCICVPVQLFFVCFWLFLLHIMFYLA